MGQRGRELFRIERNRIQGYLKEEEEARLEMGKT